MLLKVAEKSLLGLDEFSHVDIKILKSRVYKNQETFVFYIFRYTVHLSSSVMYYVLI